MNSFVLFLIIRSKTYSFKCGEDIKNKLKGVSKSQTKHIKFEEYRKCLDGADYQREFNNYFLRSINHEMYLQQVKKNQRYLYSMINDVTLKNCQ